MNKKIKNNLIYILKKKEGPKLIKNWIQQIKDHRSLPAEEEKNIEK